MPYGDLRSQIVQRFSTTRISRSHRCTIEEREEYEPLVDQGVVVYAGVDYAKILEAAENEAEVIVWDGGNNDTPFFSRMSTSCSSTRIGPGMSGSTTPARRTC